MKAEDTAFLEMEHNVKEYYKNLLIIEGKESLRISYQKRLDKIEEECQRLNHTLRLKADINAVAYDGIPIFNGWPASGMDKQIEAIFGKLETEKKQLYEKLYDVGYEIRCLEEKNDKWKTLFDRLDRESQKVLELKYRRKYSYERIGEEILTSKTNAYRKLQGSILQLSLWEKERNLFQS